MGVTNISFRIDQVLRRPVAVGERVPRPEIIVLRDGVREPILLDRVCDIRFALFKDELGSMDTDEREGLVFIFLPVRLHMWERADAVDAAVGPEVDKHNFSFQTRHREGWTVMPRPEAHEFGSAGDAGKSGGHGGGN